MTWVLAVSLCALGVPAPQAAELIIFQNVQVFDGQKMLPDTNVVVSKGLIQQVGSDVAPAGEAEVIDGRGKTLLPGLIDCHTHTFFAGQLEEGVIFGVTTELDMFSDHRFAAQKRSEQAAGQARNRADLLSAGTLVTAAEGHGTQFGLPIPTISGPEQAQDFVDARLAEGSDYIKIVYDDGQVYGIHFPTLSRKTLAAVIQATHVRKKMAVAHIGTRQAAREAIEDGIDGLVHVFVDEPADDGFVELAVRNKVFVVPTLTVLEGLTGKASGESLANDARLRPYLLPDVAGNLKLALLPRPSTKASFTAARESVRKLKMAGVAILAGSDAPNPGTAHGASIHRELELLVASGLSPTEALIAATSAPAEKFGLPDRGRIAAKLTADLVLVDGDPSKDILATRAIVGVWKNGQRIDRKSFGERVVAEVKKLADAKGAPPPTNSEAGLVSDFDGKDVLSEFGVGWSVSTDLFVGGKSTARFQLAPGGAQESTGSLSVTGRIDDKPQPRWSGVIFSPGKTMFAPANLSSKKGISFWAKGDGKTYSVMLFVQKQGFRPSIQTFVAGEKWKQYRFALKDFEGSDGSDISGLFFGGGPEVGEFSFQIDNVRFEK